MQTATVINFPDRSCEDESFAAFWDECQASGQHISRQRARRLFHAAPEEYFERAGWVYVLGNQYLADDVFKIGRTTGRIEHRMRQLFTTGVPGEFDCLHADWFSDCHHAEAYIHERLAQYRIEEAREFFCIDLGAIQTAFMHCHAFADPRPDHMIEIASRRRLAAMRRETIRGKPLFSPSEMEARI